MPAHELRSMNRRLLGTAGMGLDDGDYARIVAALGATRATGVARVKRDLVAWSARAFLDRRRAIGLRAPAKAWLEHRDLWDKEWRPISHGRVHLQLEPADAPGPDAVEVGRVLAHPAIGLESVFVHWPCPGSDLRWQWPMRIGAFAEEFDALEVGKLADNWPARNLVSALPIARDASRVELLVARASPRLALARLLSTEYKVRAAFVLLLTPCDTALGMIRAHLETLLAETQAGGFALATLPDETSPLHALNHWSEQISHNAPIDVALGRVIDRSRSLVALDLRLAETAALPVQAMAMGARLMSLPSNAPMRDLESTGKRIGATWTRSKAPADIGRELAAMGSTDSLRTDSEEGTGSALSELGTAEREAERALAAEEPARYLQGDVFAWSGERQVPETRGLVIGQRYALDLFIGEEGLGAMGTDERFPDERLPWKEDESLSLQVLFTEPRQWQEPMRGTLELERTGTSATCRFVFAPVRAGPFFGRVVVYYRGRVLQTAVLETTVVDKPTALPRQGGMRLRVEAELRRSLRTLDERRRFDACVICNHTSARKAAVTAAAKDGAYIAALGNMDAAVSRINELLTQVAHDSRRYAAGLTKDANAVLLTDLAYQGNALYRGIVIDYIQRSSSAAQLQSAEYLQIVTMEPDAIVPLEFVYQYPLPLKGAPVCPNAADALRKGECPGTCRPARSPAPHVCPMGFWGLSKVIERHIHVPDLPKAAKVLGQRRSEPIADRDELSLKGPTLLAASKEVPPARQAALDSTVRAARGDPVASVKDWAKWQKQVEDLKPVMLVALPHAAGTGANITLEIGGNTIQSALIDASYVRAGNTPSPLTLLLGCDVANTISTDAYLRHVEVFRQADAALVLGTVATVLGADAADIAGSLVRNLSKATQRNPGRFGEILRDTKRAAVADSEMVALCLVAFGDADWKLVA